MTTTTPKTPACLRFPVSAGVLGLVFFLTATPAALLAQVNPFGGDNPDVPPPAKRSNLRTDQPKEETNPAVLSILDNKPQTIPEMTRAAKQLIDLNRPALAVILLEKIVAGQPSDDALADLMTEFDSAFFLRIHRDPELQPAGAQIAILVRDAARKRLNDTDRIDTFIDQLLGDDLLTRVRALDELKQHGELAAIQLAMVLSDDARADDHDKIQQALVHFGPSADEPLLGMLDTPSEGFRARLFNVLSRRRTKRAIIRMVAPAVARPEEDLVGKAAREGLRRVLGDIPGHREAERFLREQLDRYLDMDLMIPLGPDGTIILWRWVEEDGLPMPEKQPPRIARLILAAQIAKDLYSLDPENKEFHVLYLRSILEESKELHGMNQPLVGLSDDRPESQAAGSIARQADADMLLAVYRDAIRTDHLPAAVGALEVLSAIGEPRLFESSSGRPSLLVEAVRHPDRWLRYTALQVIVKLDSHQPYPGSSFVLEALAYFSGSAGTPRVLTGDGIASRSQSWGGMLGNLGFVGDRASSGKDLFRMAARNPDYEFILIGDTIYNPGVADTVSLLRKDPRTANIPIGIVIDVNERGVGARIVAMDDRAHLLINPHDAESMAIQSRVLLEMAAQHPVTKSDRLSQAQFALETMSRFASNRMDYGYYDVSRHQQVLIAALFQPQLGKRAAPALGAIATPDAIRALVTFASQDTEVLENRGVAVVALDQAFHKRGLLLEKTDVRQIYYLYNASLNVKENEVVDLLGSILNAIEGPDWRGQAEKDNQEASRKAEQSSAIVELKAQGFQLTLEQKKELLGLLERDSGGQRSSVAGLEATIAIDQKKVVQITDRMEALNVGVVLDSTREQAFLLERKRILEKNQATLTVLTTAEKEHGDKMYKNATQLRAAIGEQEE